MNSIKPAKLLNKSFLLLILVSLITSLGFSMISTLISPYATSMGSELTAAGVISGVFSITALVFRPIGGYVTDIYNKKKLCVITTIAASVFMLGYAFSGGVFALVVMRILHGATFGISGTANLTLATEFIPDDKMGQGLGYYGLGQVFSQIVGPTIGLAIKNHFGYTVLFLLISLITVSAAVILIFAFHYHPPVFVKSQKKERTPLSLNNLIAKECIIYALVAGLFSMGNGIVNSFLVLLGENRGIENISLFFSVNALILFAIRLLMGHTLDKANLIFIVNISLITSAVSMVLIGRTSLLPVFFVAAALKAFGNVGGQISLQSACVKRVDAAKIGIATSTYYIGADIGQGLGPIWGGKIVESFGYQSVFFIMAACFLITTALFTMYQKRSLRLALQKQDV